MDELINLTGRWWGWRVGLWDSSTLRLIADNDLTYHHSVEVLFTDVAWVAIADTFYDPAFRPATSEQDFARQVINDEGYELHAWDAETSTGTVPMVIVSQSVRIVEGHVRHQS